jgi:hypothetical protein
MRTCGAERTRFCADAAGHADATLVTARSTRYWSPIPRGGCGKASGIRCTARAVEYDSASDHNGFCEASADAAKTQCHSPASGSGARTRTCAAVALPNWRSQRRRGNTRRAATGEPDGHYGRTAQLPPGGGTRRNPGGSARPRGRAALRLGQGQSILSSRLQPRPRHGLSHLLGRRADQLANQCARPGLRRSELSHS